MLKVCGIVGISNIQLFSFPGTESINMIKDNMIHSLKSWPKSSFLKDVLNVTQVYIFKDLI